MPLLTQKEFEQMLASLSVIQEARLFENEPGLPPGGLDKELASGTGWGGVSPS